MEQLQFSQLAIKIVLHGFSLHSCFMVLQCYAEQGLPLSVYLHLYKEITKNWNKIQQPNRKTSKVYKQMTFKWCCHIAEYYATK